MKILTSARAIDTQRGMVSLTITLVMMLVISVIVLGFAQISRNEQRQTLDRQLSAQAYYAAESGVNEMSQVVKTQVASTGTIRDRTSCSDTAAPYDTLSPTLSSGVSYSCVLVTTASLSIPLSLRVSNPAAVTRLRPTSGTINALHLVLKLTTTPASMAGCPASIPNSGDTNALLSASNWNCAYGVIRIDLVPTDPGPGYLTSLSANQKSFFLYPVTGAGVPEVYPASNATMLPMHCTVAQCTADVIGMNQGATYGMRAKVVYRDMDLTITGTSGGSPVTFTGAQAVIDATGKAQDVLRRVRVAIPLTGGADNAQDALISGSSICKRFGVASGHFVITSIPGQDPNNPLCQPINI